jgi:hypothetical protein
MTEVILTSNLKVLILQLLSSAISATQLVTRAQTALSVRRVEKVVEVAAVEGKVLQAEALVDLKAARVMEEKDMEVVVVVAVKVVKEEIIILILTSVIFVISQGILRRSALRQKSLQNFWKNEKPKGVETTIIKEPTGNKMKKHLGIMENIASCYPLLDSSHPVIIVCLYLLLL